MRPKNVTIGSYTSKYIVNIAFYLFSFFICILLYLHLRFIFVNTFFIPIVSIKSEINGNG